MENVLIMNRSDFKGYYNEELLANLEGCPDIVKNGVINFKTNINFEGNTRSRVMDAFNIYLRQLRKTTSRIIIT
tara:strand:- start:1008 stop:1229 length:222 start_codon:yes stop_codon:yes gene_type:complete